ncbi:hypothetical protein CPB84DRAFT_1018931 [Gymnopilus junonius]|uniref:F-box domain-containing protein n=1 Tax=Gymnopilus junonius TaxID=109634 RepID=A0A9P5NPS2_GYMJU|nr:hypothetical protein CPB84DRAFT_1018931 [Gymnopilus junonius]
MIAMSAKEYYHTNPSSASLVDLIPPEIWSTIFRHATRPDFSEYRFVGPKSLDFISGIDRDQLKEFRASLVTKRYLVRVSKAWYSIAMPFLYEHVILGTGRSIIPLCQVMKRSQEQVDSDRPGSSIGWWTKRLDVSMRDKADGPNEILSALADIMACLRNLRVLTFSVKGQGYDIRKPLPSSVLRSLSCHDTLKVVHWYNDYLQPTTGDWTSFLEVHSQLESIRGRFLLAPNNHVKLEALKTIYQCSHPKAPQNLLNFDLSSVCYAVYHIGITLDPATSFNHTFFSLLGSQLTIIQIDCLEGAYLEDFQQTFSEMEKECHNLSEIHFNLCAWSVFNSCIPGSRFPPSVKSLGIRITGATISNVDIRTFFTQALPAVLSQNLNVKMIQITNPGTVRALRSHPRSLIRGIEQVTAMGVQLLDNHARLLRASE